jgi:hypothetical protein
MPAVTPEEPWTFQIGEAHFFTLSPRREMRWKAFIARLRD